MSYKSEYKELYFVYLYRKNRIDPMDLHCCDFIKFRIQNYSAYKKNTGYIIGNYIHEIRVKQNGG